MDENGNLPFAVITGGFNRIGFELARQFEKHRRGDRAGIWHQTGASSTASR